MDTTDNIVFPCAMFPVYFPLIVLDICYSMAFYVHSSCSHSSKTSIYSEVIGSFSTELKGMTILSHAHIVDIMTQPGLFVVFVSGFFFFFSFLGF